MTSPSDSPGAGLLAAASPSVLVVEDDPGIATQLVRGLTRGGYRVDHVVTGGEALAGGNHDVVLLDLELPDADGVQVCRRLRERSTAAIIVVTAHGEEADRVRPWTPARTTTWSSRSGWPSCRPGSARCCAGSARRAR